MSTPDYSAVTERPGDGVSAEAAAMMHTRCALTAQLAYGRDVLELSCGTGQSLGWLTRDARHVVGADITLTSLQSARSHYGDRVPLVQCDVHRLPFAVGSFDVVSMHESIYYYGDVPAAFREARRVLRTGGALVVSTVNPAWPEFNPSQFSKAYFGAGALAGALAAVFPRVDMYAAFAVSETTKARLLARLKRFAVATGLIPASMRGKRWLKRLVFGALVVVPNEVDSVEWAEPLVPLSTESGSLRAFKVLYAVAKC